MVPREDLPQAISLNTIAYNTARSLGPAIGGVLLSIWNPATAFAINALSYLVLIWALLRWRPPSIARTTRHRLLPAIGAALSFAVTSSPVRRVLLRAIAFGFGAISFQALLPLVAKDQIRGDAIDFGLMFGAFGVGSVLTAIWIAKARRRFGTEATVSTAMALTAAALVALAYAQTLGWALAAGLACGSGYVATMTSLNVSVQLRSPDELLGRSLAIFQASMFGGMALGAPVWGWVSDQAGLFVSLMASAALLIASLVVLRLVAPMPKLGEGLVMH
jgi:predicted MFS family arabinose efflux permease